jgi:DNA-binding NtrC family response regulator
VLAQAAAREGKAPKELGKGACRALLEHDWPGNVRELVNAMERAYILSEGPRVEEGDLPPEIVGKDEPRPGGGGDEDGRTLAEVERDHILATLSAVGGNRTRAAERLGIGVATLYRKIEQYGAPRRRGERGR